MLTYCPELKQKIFDDDHLNLRSCLTSTLQKPKFPIYPKEMIAILCEKYREWIYQNVLSVRTVPYGFFANLYLNQKLYLPESNIREVNPNNRGLYSTPTYSPVVMKGFEDFRGNSYYDFRQLMNLHRGYLSGSDELVFFRKLFQNGFDISSFSTDNSENRFEYITHEIFNTVYSNINKDNILNINDTNFQIFIEQIKKYTTYDPQLILEDMIYLIDNPQNGYLILFGRGLLEQSEYIASDYFSNLTGFGIDGRIELCTRPRNGHYDLHQENTVIAVICLGELEYKTIQLLNNN